MTEFNSPLGRRTFSAPMREFTVEDPTDDEIARLKEAQEEIKRQRQLKANPEKERMSDSSKKRIEFLLNLTTLKKEVEINKTKFVLRTLKGKEQKDAIVTAAKHEGVNYIFELRRNLLARSLESISSLSFEEFIGSNVLEDKLNFIDEMDDALVKLLYKAYDELFVESNSKYAIDSEEKAKELVEDLKK